MPDRYAWAYSAYHLLNRVYAGMDGQPVALEFVSTQAVLDEYGITEIHEREHIRSLWFEMWRVEVAERAKKREAQVDGGTDPNSAIPGAKRPTPG